MMAFSALDDKARVPTEADVAEVLADSADPWIDLKDLMASQFDPLAEDWTFSGKKWGWSLRLKHKKRAVLYMTPSTGFFYVGFALGEKAAATAQNSDLPQSVLEIIDSSQKYAKGRAVRLEVRSAEDLDTVASIAAIKMAN
jgi:hypothetical protein